MALSKQEKKELIEAYTKNLKNSSMLFVLKPTGLNPISASDFKKKLYDNQSQFNVVKNTLFKIALNQTNTPINLDKGENAVVTSQGDLATIAKLVEEFIKSEEKVEFRQGLIEGKVITDVEFKSLANLPSREVLIAQVLSGMQGPITAFVRVLSGNISGFVNVVNAIKDRKQA